MNDSLLGGKTMGRQIAFAASATDEAALLQFLRDTADIQIFRPSAPAVAELQVDCFPPYGPDAMQYWIWNRKYTWEPKYGTVEPNAKAYARWCFVENRAQGPLIEFSRTNIKSFVDKELTTYAYGRIWWGTYNRQKGFEAWFEAIVRWIKKNGVNLCPGSALGVYCLPDALRLRQNRA